MAFRNLDGTELRSFQHDCAVRSAEVPLHSVKPTRVEEVAWTQGVSEPRPTFTLLRFGRLFRRLTAAACVLRLARLLLNKPLFTAFAELSLGDFAVTVRIHHRKIDDERSGLIT